MSGLLVPPKYYHHAGAAVTRNQRDHDVIMTTSTKQEEYKNMRTRTPRRNDATTMTGRRRSHVETTKNSTKLTTNGCVTNYNCSTLVCEKCSHDGSSYQERTRSSKLHFYCAFMVTTTT